MKKKTKHIPFYLLFLILLPNSVLAHTGIVSLESFTGGFTHPWLGIDHLSAMTAIGIWAALSNKYPVWLLPGCFLVAMIVGTLLNLSGFVLGNMELWVAFSVLLFGIMASTQPKMPWPMAVMLVMVFAFGHGYVHAAEMSGGTHTLTYLMGFVMATAALHGLGLLAGLVGGTMLIIIRAGFGLLCTSVGIILLSAI